MTNIISLLALLVGLIAFFVGTETAITLFALFFVAWGVLGLLAGVDTAPVADPVRVATVKTPHVEKED